MSKEEEVKPQEEKVENKENQNNKGNKNKNKNNKNKNKNTNNNSSNVAGNSNSSQNSNKTANHPRWWQFKGISSKPAVNIKRPFDPKNTISTADTTKREVCNPGIGVGHVIKVNATYNDSFVNSDEFNLAASEAFRQIRLNLKTNLPYNYENYKNYLKVVAALCVKVKAVERLLGWFDYTRADVPEFHNALISVTQNYTEQGRLSVRSINLISEDSYSNTLNKYNILRTTCANINIPKNFAEYISWIFGSTFIDQRAMNPEIYINELRSCPIYTGSTPTQVTQIGVWDIASGTIDDIISEAMSIIENFGLINADAEKIPNMYGKIILSDIERKQYKQNFLKDDEYFQILINNYTAANDNAYLKQILKNDYLRVDLFSDKEDSSLIGTVNGLAMWAKKDIPVVFRSQAVYLTSSYLYRVRRSGNIAIPASGGTVYLTSDKYDAINEEPYFLQYNTVVAIEDTINLSLENANNITVTANIKLAPDQARQILEEVSAINFNISDAIIAKTGYADEVTVKIAGLALSDRNEYISLLYKYANPTDIFPNAVKLIIENISTGVNTEIGDVPFDANTRLFNATVVASGNSICQRLLPFLTAGSGLWFDGAIAASDITTIQSAVVELESSQNQANITNEVNLDIFLSMVDMHFPIIKNKDLILIDSANVKTTISYGASNLMKQTYIPTIVNLADISQVLYWMYLALFSINIK